MTPLNKVIHDVWEATLREFPTLATMVGDERYNDKLEDFSLAAHERRKQQDGRFLEALQAVPRDNLQGVDRVNYDLLLDHLTTRVKGYEFPDHLMPMNQMDGVQLRFPELSELAPFRHRRDFENYLARLEAFPQQAEGVMECLEAGRRAGIVPPRIPLRTVGAQFESLLQPAAEESVFYRPFATPAGEPMRTAARKTIEQAVRPALQKLQRYFVDTYFPACRDSFGLSNMPNGEAWYAYHIEARTTTRLSAREIHQTGLDEVKRIRAEMEQVIQDSGFKGDFNAFVQFLRTDKQFYFTRAEDLLTAYRDICKRIDAELPRFFGKLPRLPYGVRPIPDYSAPAQTTAYYMPGSPEAGRAGFFYANTYRLDMRPKWEMEALSIHEAVPGHHLQIALAQELEGVPEFRKHGLDYTAYIEGWGLYSESLGREMGFYQHPCSRFGQLTYEMWRAIRLVVDTGIHALGWDRDQALKFFAANSSKTEHDMVVEVDRYIVWPGQALAYKLGELTIQRLRREAEAALGERFDIRAFHDVVLGSGAVPLSVLESMVSDWVAQRQVAGEEVALPLH